jgi:hypothetical protein
MLALVAAITAVLTPGFQPYMTSLGRMARWPIAEIHYTLTGAAPPYLERDAIEEIARVSFAAWCELVCFPIVVHYQGWNEGHVQDAVAQPDDVNAIHWVLGTQQWAAPQSYYALTTLTVRRSDGEILDADIELNAAWHRFSIGESDPEAVDLQNTLTHEIGHFLGLDHSQVPGACMEEHASKGEISKRTLSADDVSGYCFLYEQLSAGEGEAVEDVRVDVGLWLPDAGGADDGPIDEGWGCGFARRGRDSGGAAAAGGLLALLLYSMVSYQATRSSSTRARSASLKTSWRRPG